MKKGKHPVHVNFSGKLLIVGFGSIGQGVLPLILRHIGMDRKNIRIITADELGRDVARIEGIPFSIEPLKRGNYKKVLDKYLEKGDFLLNLSVDVSSVALMEYCNKRGILYLDTVVEPWLGGYTNPKLSITERSNYGLRETMLAVKEKFGKGPTAVSTHGANPGIVSHFLKRALMHIARDTGMKTKKPESREEWAGLMRKLGVKTVHIAEYDSQVSDKPKKVGRFENTWSVSGFHSEGVCQPCEMGWGTHEKYFPKNGHRHPHGCDAAIYLDQPGAKTLVRTWTPKHGPFLGRAVTHNESVSIADYYTVRKGKKATFRPTVHYAYRSCDASILSIEECFGNNSQLQKEQYILMDDIRTGMDELGVLLMGHKKGAYWYGSQLTIEETRKLAPYQNATGLQVTVGVLGAMVWAIENPNAGVVEADEMDFERIMEVMEPYLGTMTGAYTDWTPLKDRQILFKEDLDTKDPWQFKNILFSPNL
ncbi:homospermidine synthase [Candidatus Kaiserbacteria bacterium RIFCSPHIGHO2_02_FULL_55_20]|uniref:Homospermidine synthase n=1 Tax=Candidatus Kaiserbacteria bacterium RIFCSPHIGHO2_02_FULL_55_20 TaxID=1798497 RepID=A0A1F6DZP3_9BACT|nr:MAG: homospermidine synthase [Candidatus Kaiserbacteria bacterium RIFCSPHIGHO2_01_FULL_55_37]OGG66462.1 MAG: homospermidine synthase [Candidatus Kaiserbacteria bacterium RIFCSPHIGHO2_02_FULL_55_20]